MNHWQRYIRWIGWFVAMCAMIYLVYRLMNYDHYDDLGSMMQTFGWEAWMLAVVAMVLIPVQLGVEVLRWQSVLRGWKTISLAESWHQVLAGTVAGFVTPYRAGDLPARLVEAGLDISRDEWATRWRTWWKDWRKWPVVIGWTMARYVVWGVQLWCVLEMVGVHMSALQAVGSIAVYYVVISLMPALPAADVPLKGGWAVAIFGQYTDNVVAILMAVSIIWFFNTILPVLFGSLKKILYFCNRKNH